MIKVILEVNSSVIIFVCLIVKISDKGSVLQCNVRWASHTSTQQRIVRTIMTRYHIFIPHRKGYQ